MGEARISQEMTHGEASLLEARVVQTMRGAHMAQAGDIVLVAVSGGADSVALLLLLCSARQALGIRVEVAHFEHGIRGQASLADADYVRVLCEGLAIPCHVGHGNVPALAGQWHCGLEDAARRARYDYLDGVAARIGAARIAVAHQLEDQAETLLLHLVHGCGLRGLAAMRPVQGNRIRPLLDVPRGALEAYLRVKGIPWQEDETNGDTAYARNLLRQEVFPLLRRLNPRAAEAMARSATLAGRAEDTLRGLAAERLRGRAKRLPYGMFWQVDGAPMGEDTVRLLCEEAGVPPLDLPQSEALAALAPGGSANLPGGWRAQRTRTRLHLICPEWTPPPPNPADFTRLSAPSGFVGDGVRVQVLDADRAQGAVLRLRQPGDVFAPLGSTGTQKLKQTLQDAGVDRPFRDLLPVLAKGSRVLWIVGLKAGRDAAVGPATRAAIRFDYHGDLPWEIPARISDEIL